MQLTFGLVVYLATLELVGCRLTKTAEYAGSALARDTVVLVYVAGAAKKR